ncbi:odorant receptor 131-2-like [Thalassophryne amazonica]|uniref:odorant receptor 131-2-like n=1 Tax=Thalassophryne amazonica TaxID=390379 RepID=UPI0014722D28|nr:odorant receptor 131-2-like [Thalassophryne amazonica]
MNNTTASQMLPLHTPVKVFLSVVPCLLFLYVNGVMLVALLRKPLLLESSRYVLFAHLLLTDSLQLVVAMLLYIFAAAKVTMLHYMCMFLTLLAIVFVKMSPLNLTIMSLERYVAICFPLRHSEVTTTRRTGVAIGVMWAVVSLDALVQLFVFISLKHTHFTVQVFCSTQSMFMLQSHMTLYSTLTLLYFVLVSMIIIYTYIAVLVTVKSASSKVGCKGAKALKTILLHLLQLCLCLLTTLFNMINSEGVWKSLHGIQAIHVQYILFLSLLIFPKCLSPLIYGLRDDAFRRVFKYYFTFGLKTAVCPLPKSQHLK